MNWKKRYEKIKVGDKVRLIKYHPACGDERCCNGTGYFMGKTYKVTYIYMNEKFRYSLKDGCNFPAECIEKV